MTQEERAKKIATLLHRNQTRHDGKTPYIVHPEAVAKQMDTDEEKAVAWLHDVIEDCGVTVQDLLALDITQTVANAVLVLTKKEGWESYLTYILGVRAIELTRKVKIADIKHNMIGGEMFQTTYDKYMLALYILESK